MAEKQRPTLADWIVTAISPALIVGLVGSLVFFLVEILYAGKYESRLLWTLFFFVIGIVLVARISIEVDSGRAAAYGLGLAAVSWIALMAFIEYPGDSSMAPFAPVINLFLMAVVWWCAHKLTWDCTFIDEKRQASGQGILAAAGLENRADTQGQARDRDIRRKELAPEPDPNMSLLERWKRYREWRKKKPHTPGISVVWFSLAALPIFGLGQSLIPASESARRTFTFWLAAVYVTSGLGLLLTTNFLGLRRYLRQRKLSMPQPMTGVWLGLGAALVLGFVLVAALLPRPYSEMPVWDMKRAGSAARDASKNAQRSDGAGKGQGNAGEQSKAGDGKNTGPKGDPGGKGNDGKAKQGSGKKKEGDGSGESKKDDSGRDGDKNSDDEEDKQSQSKSDRNSDAKDGSKSDRRFPDTKLGNVLEKITTFLKWAFFILIGLIVIAFLFRGVLRHLGQFMPWARNLLDALHAWWARFWGKKEEVVTDVEIVPVKPRPRPFTSFTNPFADGTGEGRAVEELIEYSFTALESWAFDRNHPRRPDDTPLEFGSRLSNMFPGLQGQAQKLAVLVVRLAYANGTLPPEARQTLEFFWDHLTASMPAPAPVAVA
jgi:Domain of unknown function (DUF4129)